MSTLPPEENGEQPLGGEPTSDASTEAPSAPEAPAAPQQPVPPQQPQYEAPPQQPQYKAPPQQPQYQQPPAGYAQPGYAQPAAVNPVGNLQLNYWLSVFFVWIPALIFFLVDKDKGNGRLRQLHVANLNFSLLRTIVYVATFVLMVIPYIGWLIALLLWIGQIVLFVFHIIAAAKVAQAYQNGQPADPFILNLPMVK